MLTIILMMILITADFLPKREGRREVHRGMWEEEEQGKEGREERGTNKRTERRESGNKQHVIRLSTDDRFFILLWVEGQL